MKRILQQVAAVFRPASTRTPHRGHEGGHFVFAHIADALMAERRMSKYQQPLHRALVGARFGRVTGGGSVQGTDGAIQWVSLELELKDLDAALFFALAKLRALGAPPRSYLKFERAGRSVTVPVR